LVTGSGFEGATLVGRIASAGGVDTSRGVGVRTVLLRLVYFLFWRVSLVGVAVPEFVAATAVVLVAFFTGGGGSDGE
jgi:hypothetical protein